MPAKGTSTKVARVCAYCAATFFVIPSRVRQGVDKYCGRACSGLARRLQAGWSRHGEARPGKQSPEYQAWHGIKTRCLNPTNQNYPRYGGRGITICDAWRNSFETFLADVGRRPGPGYSIDRIDNAQGYSPANVQWSTDKEQANNRRNTRLITFNDVTRSVTAWAESLGIHPETLRARLNKGWPVERALTAPARVKNRS